MGKNGNLHEIPDTWEWTTLGEISTIYSGSTPSTKDDSNFNGDIPWITPADLSDHTEVYIQRGRRNISEKGLNSSSAVVIPAESVLFSSRAPIGYVAIAENDVTTNQGMKSFHLVDGVFNKYVYYYLKGNKSLVESFASGTTFLEVSKSRVSQVPIPIPPFIEQEHIVAKLEETFTQLEAGVAELQNAKAQLKRYRAAVLKSAVEGELTREWRESHRGEIEPVKKLLAGILEERRKKWEAEGKKGKYKEPAALNSGDLPELPKGWVWATLEQLSWNASYGTSQKCNYESDGPPVIRIPNINNGRLNLDDLKFATNPKELSDEKAIAPHDLLIIRTNGSIDLIGRAALVRTKPDIPYFFASYLIRYRLMETSKFSPWVALIWDSHFVRNWMVREAATTAGQYNVSVSKLNRLPIPLPPIEEQERLIAMVERRLSVADEIEKELDEALARAQRLRGSVLKSAFEGRLV